MGAIITFTAVGSLLTACGTETSDPPEGGPGVEAETDAATGEIAERVAEYLAAIEGADVAKAGDYWAENARLIGPGIDLNRQNVLEGMQSVFDAGTRVDVLGRKTVELFVHGKFAYEIAQAEEAFLASGGMPADTMRNNMFVRWERGPDDKWRFSRVVLGPQSAPVQ
jgi:ketosteroid isomerase-like protein